MAPRVTSARAAGAGPWPASAMRPMRRQRAASPANSLRARWCRRLPGCAPRRGGIAIPAGRAAVRSPPAPRHPAGQPPNLLGGSARHQRSSPRAGSSPGLERVAPRHRYTGSPGGPAGGPIDPRAGNRYCDRAPPARPRRRAHAGCPIFRTQPEVRCRPRSPGRESRGAADRSVRAPGRSGRPRMPVRRADPPRGLTAPQRWRRPIRPGRHRRRRHRPPQPTFAALRSLSGRARSPSWLRTTIPGRTATKQA